MGLRTMVPQKAELKAEHKKPIRRITAPLTDTEIDEIDTWGFARRIRDRSTAIRTNLFETLAQAGGPPAQVLIDSSAVKAHRCASGRNVWPAPSARGSGSAGLSSLHKRIRPS